MKLFLDAAMVFFATLLVAALLALAAPTVAERVSRPGAALEVPQLFALWDSHTAREAVPPGPTR
jgi:hypothetical protein